jgi:septum site-determining protein MinC
MDLYAVVADVQSTREAARAVDLRAMPAKAPAAEETEEEAPSPKPRSTEAILVRRTVRSGQVVQYPGHVVIVGDVNLDGEVLAAGDVIIWGKLRGVVHAGAVGDDSAIVCALQMQPMQLRIGNYIARAPEDQGREPGEPEVAFVRNGGIVAESWNNGTLDI